ncbi:MAG: G/U mismatch-specific DNA glycosylase [Actinomycetota bacterium]|nr:G/U mismatch-specific DNA glycosylase [Actinomycetota bacterium]
MSGNFQPWRPSREQIEAAEGGTVPDVIAPGLRVLFCGINPGRYSAAVGHHFARPGNRFWKTLQAAGFTPRVLSPFEERRLLEVALGITNLVERATATAANLSNEELRAGARRLEWKVTEFAPRLVAFLGISAYRMAFGRPEASVGRQGHQIGQAGVWLLPNPSGLNAHYQLEDLSLLFVKLLDDDLTPEASKPDDEDDDEEGDD